MKIIIHLYLNVNCSEISSSEIQIESNEITVKELKKTLSEIYLIKASEQILTMKLFGLKAITLSDEFPLSFFYIKNNSEIYLDTIHKYENKAPAEISKINSLQNYVIPNIFNRYYNDKIKKDLIIEKIEENSEDENEIENKKKFDINEKNSLSMPIQIKETNPDYIIKNALYMIKSNKFLELIHYLDTNKNFLGCVQNIINKKNNWNALHYSCYYGQKEITAFLLTYNYRNNSIHDLINSLTKENYTPLHIACYKCKAYIVKILLLYFKDIEINLINNKGETPLHIACKKNSMKIVSMLIASKANLFIKDKNNKKPIELTTDNNIKKLLVKSMVKSPNFKNEDLNNINIDISLYKKNYFTPPRPPKIIGILEQRGELIPLYKAIFVEIDPISGNFKKFKSKKNYPNNCYSDIKLNNINLCKKENSDSKEEFYFIIISQKTELYRVKNKNARDKWIKSINESVVYYKYWIKFQEKNKKIKDYLKTEKNTIEFIDYKNGEVRIIDEDGEIIKKKKEVGQAFKRSKTRIIYHNINNNINIINNNNINNINYIGNNNLNHKNISTVKKDNNEINSKKNILQKNLTKKISNLKKEEEKNVNDIKKEKFKGNKFEDYIIIGLLGTGSFGRVFKVKIKDDITKKIFAMKVINKNLLIRKKQLKYAVSECSILKKCDCPFIVKLYYSFQTLENLYMIEEYYPGGDLQYHLKINLLEENEAKFYIAEIILAIEHLHDKNIIYRDLKPENVLIGEDNHIVLADFGLAKEGIHGNSLSNSFCGSPAYLPPETVNMKGVGRSGDLYGIGAVLYEMISGTPPFFSNEISVLFNKIKNCQLVLHNYFSNDLKDLLKKLLEKDPNKRFGVNNKDEIKKHPFFKGIEWEKLKNKEIKPPTNFMKQKSEHEKSNDDDIENKKIKNIKFNDVDYTEENKFSKRVKNFSFIRKTNEY